MKRRLRALVTCGPTREPLDPVRFISNRSTGKLGFELARAFAKRGHRVTLAAGPVELPDDLPQAVRVLRFETALELRRIALKEFKGCDAVCMTAAVADFRPAKLSAAKIKRGKGDLTVRLVPNPDILEELGRRKRPNQVLAGFSVESGDLEARARRKLMRKNLDLLAAQTVGRNHNPFGRVALHTTLIGRGNETSRLRGIAKSALAARIVRKIESLAASH